MLQSLHNKTASFFVKIILGLVIVSFALVGMGDMFRSGAVNTVVQVGDSTITTQEFSQELNTELNEYRRMLGDKYSPDLLKTLGIPQQILSKLIDRKLIEEEAKALGIAIPDSHLKSELRANPAFHGEEGSFDAALFKRLLMNNGFTEQNYLALLKKEAAADMLIQSAFSGIKATDAAARLAYLYENEKRLVDILVFSPELVKNVQEPSAAELERFYEKNADGFRADEHRIFSLVALDAETLASQMSISDEDVLFEYQSRIEEYREPEKREVKQLLFEDADTAEKAADKLASGTSMEAVAKELGAINSSLKLGNVTASGVIPEAEKAIFALDKGAYSTPIQSSFGWHIFQVTNITEERTRPLAEVKDELVTYIRNERVGEEVYSLSNTLQDDLAGGASIEEAARGVGTEVKSFGPISSKGTSPDGTEVKLPEGYSRMLSTAFELAEGETSNLMESSGGSYYALRVDSIQPERVRALDEIKGMVVASWKDEQKEKNLYQLASGIATTLANEDVANVAAKTGARLHRQQEISRDSSEFSDDKQIPSMMLGAIFSAEKGAATDAFALSDGSYAVAKVASISTLNSESEEGRKGMEQARENLRVLYGDEFFQQYMAYLRKKHGVSQPNQAAIDSLIQ